MRKTRNSYTLSKFSIKLDFDISKDFPLLTTKKMYWKGIVHELLWFIKGDTDSKNLERVGVHICAYCWAFHRRVTPKSCGKSPCICSALLSSAISVVNLVQNHGCMP